jgi:protein-S-isoprenylcysteine O-methyltransferase Ste14
VPNWLLYVIIFISASELAQILNQMILIPLKYRKELIRIKSLSALIWAAVARDKFSFLAIYLTEDSILVALAFAYVFHLSLGFIPLPQFMVYMAIGAIILGESIRLWSTYTLGKFFTYIVVISRNHRLVMKGPYRFVRHPAYLGGLILCVGFAIASQSWIIGVTIVLLLLLAYAYRIHVEESALGQKFGREYKEYSKRTAMLIPHVL